MLIDWFIYWFLIWGLVATLNATVFKKQPASRTTAWVLTVGMFFVNLLALTALQFLRYQMISQDLGIDIKPRGPADFGGAFAASWFFFVLLRKVPRQPKASAGETLSPKAVEVSERNTTPQQAVQPSAIVMNTSVNTASLNGQQQTTVDEDHIYALIAKELETGVADKGLWTRLFAECDGDEKQTKVLYIKGRADRLISAERSHLEQAAREQATLTKNQQAIHQEKREALLKDRLKKAKEQIDLDGYQTLGDLVKYASRQGYSKAKFLLGCLYRDGQVVVQDKKEALYWIELAAGEAYEPAMAELKRQQTTEGGSYPMKPNPAVQTDAPR